MERDFSKVVANIEKAIGYHFNDVNLLAQAFTRSSCAEELGVESNENLEFIGDRVLDYIVTKVLVEKLYDCKGSWFGLKYSLQESDLTTFKQGLVKNETLARAIDEKDLAQYLRMGNGDIIKKVNQVMKVKADLFEAIVGAVAIDSRWNTNILEDVIDNMLDIRAWIDDFDNELAAQDWDVHMPDNLMDDVNLDNAINVLQELAQKGYCNMPIYNDPNEQYYNNDGELVWKYECEVEDWGIKSTIFALSKKVAKKIAAYDVLCQKYGIKNKYIK